MTVAASLSNKTKRIGFVVEIVANYDDVALDEWSDLTDSIKQAYHWPSATGKCGYNVRKTI
jgi:hypothetical protein